MSTVTDLFPLLTRLPPGAVVVTIITIAVTAIVTPKLPDIIWALRRRR